MMGSTAMITNQGNAIGTRAQFSHRSGTRWSGKHAKRDTFILQC